MFNSTRLKLTAWYLAIIMTISILFSAAIYTILTHEFERGFKRVSLRYKIRESKNYYLFEKPEILEPNYLEQAEARIRLTLIYINLIIFGTSAVAGYFLAGRTLKPIKLMLDEQNRFIADASHELRTPLTGLKTSLEVYLREKKHKLAEADQLALLMLNEVNSLQLLTDNLTDLAQYQENGDGNHYETISLKQAIEEARKKIVPLAKEKNIILKSNIQNFFIKGDYMNIVRLFVIFLDNAVKYSPDGSTVEIETLSKNNSVTVSIADHGIGIAERHLKHIFDRFYRVDQSRTKTDIKGYGLGLSIAQKIIKSHKALINVKSRVNKGTAFYITFEKINKDI